MNYGDGTRFVAEIPIDNPLDVGRRDGPVFFIRCLKISIAEAVQFVQPDCHREAAVVLQCHLALADDAGLGTFEFIGSETGCF